LNFELLGVVLIKFKTSNDYKLKPSIGVPREYASVQNTLKIILELTANIC